MQNTVLLMFEKRADTIFAPSKLWLLAGILLILACGLGARLYDLKDPPLDYASTRQLRSALIARGKYYPLAREAPQWKREMASRQGGFSMIEPTVMETLVAGTYWVVGGEHVWIARIYSSVFWVLGGVAVYQLAREMVGANGAMVGLMYYIFAPFGVIASRSFQPDPLMTGAITFAWWAFYRWHQEHSWGWAVSAGLFAGLAMFVKSTSVFFLLGGMGVLVLMRQGLKNALKDLQVWLIVALSALPVLTYHLYGLFIVGALQQQFRGRFFPEMLTEAQFYRQLLNAVGTVVGHELLLLPALLGLILLREKEKVGYVLGIGGGYLIYILAFSYHSTTHYYYHLPFIPLVALTLASFSHFLIDRLHHPITNNLMRAGMAAILLLGVGGTYYRLHQESYRHEPGWYWKVTDEVDRQANIAVLSQDYGNRIAYYGWIKPKVWLGVGDSGDFQQEFRRFIENMDYFIITRTRDLERQEKLHDRLSQYQIHAQGGGYIIFDLNHKVNP